MDTKPTVAVPPRLLLNPLHFLALGFGSGLAPRMPGTAGTLAGLFVFVILLPEQDWRVYLAILVTAFIAGIFICEYTARALQVHDHGGIVWDEMVGYWLTMFMVPRTMLWIIVGFVLFRIFDILKPWPISLADKHVKGGLGIMLDDILAAVFSLLIIQLILYLL